jgi:hypothetical protein
MLYLHYTLIVVLSLAIIFYPNMNKFQLNIINSNIYLEIVAALVIFFLTLENYLLGILLVIFYILIRNSSSKEINEGFTSYYKKKSLDKY